MKREWASHLITRPPIVGLGGITLVSLLLLLVPFWSTNGLQTWDAAGHLFNAEFGYHSLFPDFSGWNPFNSGGFAQGYFYPPLFYWLVALLAHLTGLGVLFSFKLLISIAILLLPFSFYYLARSFDLDSFKATLFAIVGYAALYVPNLFFENGALGGNFDSTFSIGLFPNAFALPFFFFALACLHRDLNQGTFHRAALLISFTILVHYIGIILLVLSVGLLAFSFSVKRFFNWLKIVLLVVLLTAFWWVPFLVFKAHSFSILFLPTITPLFLIIALTGLLLLSFGSFFEKNSPIDYLLLSVGFSFLIVVAFAIPVQLFRLIIPLAFLILLLLVKRIPVSFWPALVAGSFLIVVAFYPVINVVGVEGSSTTITKLPSSLGPNPRYLAVVPHLPFKDSHTTRYAPTRFEYLDLAGLFVESSLSSRFVSDWKVGFDWYSFVWGDYVDVRLYPVDLAEKSQLLQAQARVLGLDAVLVTNPESRFDLNTTLVPAGFADVTDANTFFGFPPDAVDQHFPLYWRIFPENKSIEPLSKSVVFSASDDAAWRSESIFWFFDRDQLDHYRVRSSIPLRWNLAVGNEPTQLNRDLNVPGQFSILIDSEKDIPVVVKESYFPNWHAYQNGKEIPIYQSTPNWMVVYGRGLIEFQFEKSPFEWMALFISGLTLAGLLAGGWLWNTIFKK